jgi:ankyrin repeat protein
MPDKKYRIINGKHRITPFLTVTFLAVSFFLLPLPIFAGENAKIKAIPEIHDKGRHSGQTGHLDKEERLPHLHSAIKQHQLHDAIRLIEEGADIHQRDSNGFTPLMYAARIGDTGLIRLLVEKGGEIDIASHSGRTPLIEAVINNHKENVDLLIASGANLKPFIYQAKIKQTSQGITEQYGKNRRTQIPMGASANFGARGGHEPKVIERELMTVNPLRAALGSGHEEMAQYMLQTYYHSEQDNRLITWALRDAILQKNISKETIVLLLEKQTDVNHRGMNNTTPLMLAVSQGKTDIIALLLAKGAEIDTVNSIGRTPLLFAINKGDREAVALLLEHGASTASLPYEQKRSMTIPVSRARKSRGKGGVGKSVTTGYAAQPSVTAKLTPDPFVYAIKQQSEAIAMLILEKINKLSSEKVDSIFPLVLRKAWYDLADMLIKQGADVNMDHVAGVSLLNGVVSSPSFGWKQRNDTVAYLCERGAQVNVADRKRTGYTPLHYAAKLGDVPVATLMLKYGADINVVDQSNRTPLLAAVENRRNTETVRLLLEHGADPNHLVENQNSHHGDGFTPLKTAIRAGNLEAARLLVDHGADVRADCMQGMVVEVMVREKDELIRFLVQAGAELNEVKGAKRKKGYSPLMYGGEIGNTEYLQLFLDNGAEVDLQNGVGDTALLIGASANKLEAISLLLANGAEVDFQNGVGDTALLIAVSANKLETISLLLANGAGVDLQNDNGDTALIKASAAGNLPIVRVLVDGGADPSIGNKGGLTPYWFAKRNNDEEMAEYLAAHGADTTAYASFIVKVETLKANGMLPKTISAAEISPQELDRYMAVVGKFGITDPGNYQPDPRLASPEKTWEAHKEALLNDDVTLFKKTLIRPDHDLVEIYDKIGSEKRQKLVRDMRVIKQITLEGDRAKYRIKREINGEDITFYIYFSRLFGEWKIEDY